MFVVISPCQPNESKGEGYNHDACDQEICTRSLFSQLRLFGELTGVYSQGLQIFLGRQVGRDPLISESDLKPPTLRQFAQSHGRKKKGGQMTEAFPWDTAPRYLLRDRDKSYGPAFRHCVRVMGITEVITAPRSPWQNPYVERLIGSVRRECLDHVIIFSERHLRRVLSSYFQYHHEARTHLSLDKDCPRPRRVQLPSAGHNIIAFPEVGGLHHRYERRAA